MHEWRRNSIESLNVWHLQNKRIESVINHSSENKRHARGISEQRKVEIYSSCSVEMYISLNLATL